MNDGTEATVQVFGTWPDCAHPRCKEELDVDVELLNWEDCAQNLVSRASCLYMNRSEAGTAESLETSEGASKVDKTWRQISSQKYRSILDLLGKKASRELEC